MSGFFVFHFTNGFSILLCFSLFLFFRFLTSGSFFNVTLFFHVFRFSTLFHILNDVIVRQHFFLFFSAFFYMLPKQCHKNNIKR